MRKQAIVAVTVVAALAAGVGVWRFRASREDARAPGGSDGDASSPRARRSSASLIATQEGVPSRRLAGTVKDARGAPVVGATVTLASAASVASDSAPEERASDAAGTFDFGEQEARSYTVSATAPGTAGASVDIDLRDATAAADSIQVTFFPCTAAYFGTISDASGGPIVGASVSREATYGGPSTRSGTDGSYELCFPPGTVAMRVMADGYASLRLDGFSTSRIRQDLALVPEGIVSGRTVRADGVSGVAGAIVRLEPLEDFSREAAPTLRATSGADGGFRILGVAPGRYEASAEGLDAKSLGTIDVVVPAGRTVDDLTLVLAPLSTIKGKVIADGKPLANALITAGTHRHRPTAVTQGDGTFSLRVPRGRAQLLLRGHRVITPASVDVNDAVVDVLIEVNPLARIVGKVTRKGVPVPGAEVSASGMGGEAAGAGGRVVTDTRGAYVIYNLVGGSYEIGANSDVEGAFAPLRRVEVAAGAEIQADLDLALAGSIAGRVENQQGRGLSGMVVVCRMKGDQGRGTSGADGSFSVGSLSGGGAYTCVVFPGTGRQAAPLPFVEAKQAPVEVADGDTHVSGLVLRVRFDDLSITGRVVDAEGKPIPDAFVTATPGASNDDDEYGDQIREQDDSRAGKTGAEGEFVIAGLLAGPYVVRARSGDGSSGRMPNVRAGAAGIELALIAPGGIEGTLVGFRGAPTIRAWSQSAGPRRFGAMVTGSTFRLRSLPPGTYRLDASGEGFHAEGEAVVTAGANASVTLLAVATTSIDGRIEDFATGSPLAGFLCSCGTGGDSVVTSEDGRFSLAACPGDAQSLFCRGGAPLWLMVSRRVAVPAGQTATVRIRAVPRYEGPMGNDGIVFGDDYVNPVVAAVRDPAAAAGVRSGDVIVAVDGVEVSDMDRMAIAILIASHPPGSIVRLTIRRAGADLEIQFTTR